MAYIAAIIVYSIFIIGYLVLAWAIAYHVFSYTTPHDITRLLFVVFAVLSVALIAISLYYFMHIPWSFTGEMNFYL